MALRRNSIQAMFDSIKYFTLFNISEFDNILQRY